MRALLIFALFAQPLHATVLIQGPQTSRIDYETALKADPGLASPIESYLAGHPLEANRDALVEAFTLAQKKFLEGSREESRARFKSVIDMLGTDEWSAVDRAIFMTAALRLAQLEDDGNRTRVWLALSITLGDDVKIDQALFPPPLLASRERLRAEIPRARLPDAWIEAGWSHAVINGRVCALTDCPALPLVNSPARLTLLSKRWANFTTHVPMSELGGVAPKREPWASGDCARPKLHPQVDALADVRVFCGDNTAKLNFQPTSRPASDSIPKMEIREPASAFYENKWFWAGVGAVAIAVAVASANKNDDGKASTSYGY